MSHEEREHRSAPVPTDKELGLMWCRVTGSAFGLNEARNVAMLALHTARAERDAALAEVARLKALVIDCIPFIGYQASVEDLKARAYEAVDYDAYCKAHYATKEAQP